MVKSPIIKNRKANSKKERPGRPLKTVLKYSVHIEVYTQRSIAELKELHNHLWVSKISSFMLIKTMMFIDWNETFLQRKTEEVKGNLVHPEASSWKGRKIEMLIVLHTS